MKTQNLRLLSTFKKCFAQSYACGTLPLEVDFNKGKVLFRKTKRFRYLQAIHVCFLYYTHALLLVSLAASIGIYTYTNNVSFPIIVAIQVGCFYNIAYHLIMLEFNAGAGYCAGILNYLLRFPLKGIKLKDTTKEKWCVIFIQLSGQQVKKEMRTIIRVTEFAHFYLYYVAPCLYILGCVVYWDELFQIVRAISWPMGILVDPPDSLINLCLMVNFAIGFYHGICMLSLANTTGDLSICEL